MCDHCTNVALACFNPIQTLPLLSWSIIIVIYILTVRLQLKVDLYNYTSSVRGPTTDNGSVEVELQNGFRFLEQQYTYVIVSFPNCVT